jgi:hypothetical protein
LTLTVLAGQLALRRVELGGASVELEQSRRLGRDETVTVTVSSLQQRMLESAVGQAIGN